MNARTGQEPQPATPREAMTFAAWQAAARERYATPQDIRFVCPVCSHVASVREFEAAGDRELAGQGCIGRLLKGRDAWTSGPGPCNYAGFGLFRLSPIRVIVEGVAEPIHVFDFGDRPLVVRTAKKMSRKKIATRPVEAHGGL